MQAKKIVFYLKSLNILLAFLRTLFFTIVFTRAIRFLAFGIDKGEVLAGLGAIFLSCLLRARVPAATDDFLTLATAFFTVGSAKALLPTAIDRVTIGFRMRIMEAKIPPNPRPR